MPKTEGYSIWMMPTGAPRGRLEGMIYDLSLRYCTPLFEPHVTLVGGLKGSEKDIKHNTAKLSMEIKPFQINLNDADYRNEFFKALFLRAEKDGPIIEAHSKAREAFGLPADPDYMPHLSLLYGNLDMQMKKEIIERYVRNVDTEFTVNKLHLFSTDGEVHMWKEIEQFPLD